MTFPDIIQVTNQFYGTVNQAEISKLKEGLIGPLRVIIGPNPEQLPDTTEDRSPSATSGLIFYKKPQDAIDQPLVPQILQLLRQAQPKKLIEIPDELSKNQPDLIDRVTSPRHAGRNNLRTIDLSEEQITRVRPLTPTRAHTNLMRELTRRSPRNIPYLDTVLSSRPPEQ